MKRLVLPLAIAALAVGAAAAPDARAASAGPAAIADSTACTRPVPPNTGEWKMVEVTNVTFCVPADWRVSANQARARGNTIRWGNAAVARQQVTVSGGPGGMSRTSIANSGGSSAGTTMARRITENEVIGGQMANIWYEEGTGRVATGVSFTERPFAITGEASGRANVDLQLAVYRTVRFID